MRFSAAGAAGVMGNLSQEGGFDPLSIERDYAYKTVNGVPIQTYKRSYADNINNGRISCVGFYDSSYSTAHPLGNAVQKGYGIAGWTFWTFKKALWEYVHNDDGSWNGKDIGSIATQLNFLGKSFDKSFVLKYQLTKNASTQIYDLPAFLKTTNDPADAALKFHNIYEGSNDGPSQIQERINDAKSFYNKYKDLTDFSLTFTTDSQQVNMQKSELVRIATEEAQGHNLPKKYWDWYPVPAKTPWCAVFVSYCLDKAGISGLIKQTGCNQIENEAKQKGLQIIEDGTQIKAGDIIIFSSTSIAGAFGWYSHTGIAIKDYDPSTGKIETAEGNTDYYLGYNNGRTSVRVGGISPNSTFSRTNAEGKPMWIRVGIRLNGEGDAVIGTSNSYNNDIGLFQNFNFSWLKNLATKMSDLFKSPQGSSTTPQKSMTVSYETKTAKIRRDLIKTVDADANSIRVKGNNLLTFPSYVESPFIIVKIGNYTFGSYSKSKGINSWKVEYPNFVTGLSVVKVNGTVNQYTINLTYQIEVGEDPNFVDKVLSTVGYGIIKISYGDWMVPNFIYKEEQAIITKVTTSVEFNRSKINYTIYCTSNALSLLGTCSNFPKKVAQPSHVIMQLLQSKQYGLTDIFPGMKSRINKLMLIPRDDQEVEIPAKKNMDVFSYINFLVTCMRSNTSSGNLNDSSYYLTMNDDVLGQYGGAYFQITKVDNKINAINLNQMNVYTVDVGYPGDTPVVNFQIRNDNSWSLLYDYNERIAPQTYKYSINNDGQIYTESSPSIMISDVYNKPMSTQRSWWTKMTQFPINAELTIKGLLKPAMLMTYVRINSFFYGQRHISSGLYIITKQTDTVSGNGYRTSLQLTRVAGDLDYMETKYDTIEYKVPVYKVYQGGTTVNEDGYSGKNGKF